MCNLPVLAGIGVSESHSAVALWGTGSVRPTRTLTVRREGFLPHAVDLGPSSGDIMLVLDTAPGTKAGFRLGRDGTVLAVHPGQSAEKAGMRVDDVVTTVDGTPVGFQNSSALALWEAGASEDKLTRTLIVRRTLALVRNNQLTANGMAGITLVLDTPKGQRTGFRMGRDGTVLAIQPGTSRLNSPHRTSPHLTSPHLISPHLTTPHRTLLTTSLPPRPHHASPTPPPPLPGSISDEAGLRVGDVVLAVDGVVVGEAGTTSLGLWDAGADRLTRTLTVWRDGIGISLQELRLQLAAGAASGLANAYAPNGAVYETLKKILGHDPSPAEMAEFQVTAVTAVTAVTIDHRRHHKLCRGTVGTIGPVGALSAPSAPP